MKPSIIILPETTKKPITLIGKRAGICWGADITDDEKNYKRGLKCLESNHGRTIEFVNIEAVFSDWSSRVIREWYTHIGGAPTRLQASTRYIDYHNKGLPCVVPDKIQNNPEALKYYKDAIKNITYTASTLEHKFNISKEDIAMLFPLGMCTTIVDKRNLRNVIEMAHQRTCSRAYWEYRRLFKKYAEELKKIDDEWAYIVDNYFVSKCEVLGYCTEEHSCKRKPKKR